MSAPIGQLPMRANVLGITNADPCVVTIDENPGYVTGDFVRLTDLNSSIPTLRGMDPLNNYRWKIVLQSDTTFYLKDPITDLPIDSTNFPPYVEGGYCNLVQNTYIFYPSEDQEFPN